MKVELDLSNYATKPGVKKQQLWIPKRSELTSLKMDDGELGIDKLKTDPTDLSRLSNVVDNDAIGSDLSNELVIKKLILLIQIKKILKKKD